jgi:16S rRNA (cytidine1402-2'-O)-methyltransferase
VTAPRGRLVLVATPIGNLGDLSPRALETLASADVVACEDTRRSGRLLAHAGVAARRLVSLHGHNEAVRAQELVALLEQGATVALVSDAGTPVVSDPGSRLVTAALAVGAEVSAVPGPSAVLTALVVSGLDVARFRFEGFLPRKGPARRERLAEIAASPSPSVVFESPQRLASTLADLERVCGAERRVVIARELTKLHEEVWRGRLGDASGRAAPARGEHVLVVDKAPTSERRDERSGSALDDLVERLLEAGLSRRDATIAAEVALGVPHRLAYAAANRAVAKVGGTTG